MTDKEIIKALECCPDAITGVDCNESKCPAFKRGCIFFVKDGNMNGFVELIPRKLIEETPQLITCQKSQIEDLREALEERMEIINALIAGQETLQKHIDTMRIAAIGEFAERLKEESEIYCSAPNGAGETVLAVSCDDIDTLVKEMMEDTDNV